MKVTLAGVALVVWVPVVVVLFRAIGPSRAVLVGLLGGLLYLPVGEVRLGPPGFQFPVNKFTMTGLGLLLGCLVFDRQTILRLRPRWPDLAMAAYYLAPLIGLITGISGSAVDILDVMIVRGLGWIVPYAMGRAYFGQEDGPTRVAVALTISGLSYIPFCLYEEFAGPSRYLGGLLYGIPYHAGMVDRLGGWRPEVFLGNGLTVAAWMALTTVMAGWLWLGRIWRPGKWPAWLPPLALLATTLSCRGIYGYLILAIGLTTVVLTRWLRSRSILLILLIVPFFYMILRASGLWDGAQMVEASSFLGRSSTVQWRLQAEDRLIGMVLEHDPVFGFGNYVWHAKGIIWPDGNWLHALWMGGLVGLTLQMIALHVFPAILGLSRPSGRPSRSQAMTPLWALAAWCTLEMIDTLHNTHYLSPTALIVGTLVGNFLARASGPLGSQSFNRDPIGPTKLIPLIITIAVLLAVEVLGSLPRSPALLPEPPHPDDSSTNIKPR